MAQRVAKSGTGILSFVLLLALVTVGYTQEPTTITKPDHRADPVRPVPLAHLYWHFLVYQQHLEDTADAREKQDQSGEWLRNYMQTKLGFSAGDYQPIRDAAMRLSKEIAPLNAQAKAIIAEDRAARRQRLFPADAAPPGRDKLKALTAQREAAIQSEIDHIDAVLPPWEQTQLQKFLTEQFSQNVIAARVDRHKQFVRPLGSKTTPASVQP